MINWCSQNNIFFRMKSKTNFMFNAKIGFFFWLKWWENQENKNGKNTENLTVISWNAFIYCDGSLFSVHKTACASFFSPHKKPNASCRRCSWARSIFSVQFILVASMQNIFQVMLFFRTILFFPLRSYVRRALRFAMHGWFC